MLMLDYHKLMPGSAFSCYSTTDEIYAWMQNLAATYPTLATWIDTWGSQTWPSWEKTNGLTIGDPTFPKKSGYNIKVIKITNSAHTFTKPVILITGGMHARELAGPESAARFADYLLTNYGVDAEVTALVDFCEIHIIPLVNPDGHVWVDQAVPSSTRHYLWRKNVDYLYCPSPGGDATYGADINRNFNFKWGIVHGGVCDMNYDGPSAASEPETAAIQAYMSSIFIDQRGALDTDPAPDTTTGLFIDLHSYGGYVLWPWGWTGLPAGSLAPNAVQLRKLGEKLNYWFGTRAEPGFSTVAQPLYKLYDPVMQYGTGVDYAYGQFGVGSISLEIGSAFFQSPSIYTGTYWPNVCETLMYAVKAARRPYQTPFGPDSVNLTLSESAVAADTKVTLTGKADNKRFKPATTGAAPSVSRYTVDNPSWIPDTETFEVAIETPYSGGGLTVYNLSAVIDTTGWGAGKHTIFVETRDSAGNWGAPSAVFLTIVPPPVSYTPTVERCTFTGNLKGYAFGCYDANGKIYFAPCYTTQGDPSISPQYIHGYGVRFDSAIGSSGFTAAPGQAGSGWEVCNFADPITGNAEALGFHGAAYVNGFVYYAPLWGSNPAGVYNGTATRYNTSLPFVPASSQVFNITSLGGDYLNAKGFVGVVTAGRYLYFVPHLGGTSGLVVRFDTLGLGAAGEAVNTTAAFANPANWNKFDLTSKSLSAKGYHLGCYDGSKWVYFSPNVNPTAHGIVARYDTAGVFTVGTNWEIFDVTTLKDFDALGNPSLNARPEWGAAKQFYGCVKAGKWVYFVGNNPTIFVTGARYLAVVRYDSTKVLTDWSAWQIVNGLVPIQGAGFAGCSTDGTYVYMAEDFSLIGDKFCGAGMAAIHDSSVADLTTGWETISLGLSQPNQSHHGNVLYGGYVYNIPLKRYVNSPLYNVPNAQASRFVAKSVAATSVNHTVTTAVAGLQITIDGVSYASPQVVSWIPGASHILLAPSPQLFSGNYKYFDHWDDGSTNPSRSVNSPSTTGTIWTAYFTDVNPHPVPAPSIPLGSATGYVGVSYSFGSSITSVCDASHVEKVRFDWGDDTPYSEFADPTYLVIHSWPNAGTYYVKAQAQCETTPGKKQSVWTSSLRVDITVSAHVVPTPSVSGEDNAVVGTSYSGTAVYSLCQTGHVETFKFDWGDGTIGEYGGITQYHTYVAAGNYSIKIQAKCETLSVFSSWSDLKSVNISGHIVQTASKPLGPTTGNVGTSYRYTSTVSLCDKEHTRQIMFDWGDGTFSDWVNVGYTVTIANAYHTFNANGTYLVKAKSKCLTTLVTSALWSDFLSVIIGVDAVATPSTPTGSATPIIGVSSIYSSTVSHTHATELRFDWGNGVISGWGSLSQSYFWSAAGTYIVKAQARCTTIITSVSDWSTGLSVTVPGIITDIISAPSTPTGITNGTIGVLYTYASIETHAHSTELRFDWGDGVISGWGDTSKSWSLGGTYLVRSQARCLTPPNVVSEWSSAALTVTIAGPVTDTVNVPGTPTTTSVIFQTDIPYTFSVTWSHTTHPTVVQIAFDWGDGTAIAYKDAASSPYTESHTWVTARPDPYLVKVMAKCKASNAESGWSESLSVIVNAGNHVVQAPVILGVGRSIDLPETVWSFLCSWVVCQQGHTLQVQFDFDDGHKTKFVNASNISKGGYLTHHTFSGNGPFYVRAKAKCLETGIESAWSESVKVDKTDPNRTKGKTSAPTGNNTGFTGTLYNFDASGIFHDKVDPSRVLQYRFYWGDGVISGWGAASQSHSWSKVGTFYIRAQAKCLETGITSGWTYSKIIKVAAGTAVHTVMPPGIPVGTITGFISIPYNYSDTYSLCQTGHTMQIRFDWGDGTFSSWGAVTASQSHSWTSGGIYQVEAQLQCVTTGEISEWSEFLEVTINAGEVGVDTVAPPTTPTGPNTGTVGTTYSYVSTESHTHITELMFDWGDGTFSSWADPSVQQTHHWIAAGTYLVKAQARCVVSGLTSAWSGTLTVVISPIHVVPAPGTPSGPATGVTGVSYTYATVVTHCSVPGHTIQIRFDWGDGTYSMLVANAFTLSYNHLWNTQGVFTVKAQAKCLETGITSVWSGGFDVTITPASIESDPVATPSTPTGPIVGTVNTSYVYSTTDSHTHTIQLRFDWGDGTFSSWGEIFQLSQSQSWTSGGVYSVRAQARCSVTGRVSDWSASLLVTISGGIVTDPVATPSVPTGTTSGSTGTVYLYSTTESHIHATQIRFDWGDGVISIWGLVSQSHSWLANGTYSVRAQARCSVTGRVSDWSVALSVVIGWHTIDAPGYLEGANWGYTNVDYSYSTTYWAPCDNPAHTWYIRVDWGDGVIGAWQNVPIYTIPLFWHSWSISGLYSVKAQVKCMYGGVDTAISNWGASITVDIRSGFETVTTPNVPTGIASVMAGAANQYSVIGSYSTLGHPIEYQFDWGDGNLSGWSSGSNISYAWQTGGTFQVKARARCTVDTSVISYWSNALYVNVIAGEMIYPPTILSGPSSGGVNTAYVYTTGGAYSSLGHSVQYQFTWGDGSTSGWLAIGVITGSHPWATAGNYTISVMARCYSHGIQSATKSMIVSIGAETVSTPNPPAGNQIIEVNTTHTYILGGSVSSAGHALEYEIDWGDGTVLSWSASLSLTHVWIAEGMYWVRVRARCAAHTSIVSDWSTILGVLVVSSVDFLWEVSEAVTNDGFCFMAKADGDAVYFAGVVASSSLGYELVPVVPVPPGVWRVEKRASQTGVFQLDYTEPSSIISSGCKDIEIYGNDIYLAGFEHNTIPQQAYCIAWYKINEGSGVVLGNSAPDGSLGGGLFPSMAIVQRVGTFWTYRSGFGATQQMVFGAGSGIIDFAWAKPNRTIGGVNKAAWGMFVFRKTYPGGGVGGYTFSAHLNIIGTGIGTRQNYDSFLDYEVQWGSHTSVFTTTPTLTNIWTFNFMPSDGIPRMVKPDGTLVAATTAASLTQTLNYHYVFCGCGWGEADPPTLGYYPGGSAYGDLIIYDQTALTLAEWAVWYDSLRARYGMAARSGW